jgi:hypothetical protein
VAVSSRQTIGRCVDQRRKGYDLVQTVDCARDSPCSQLDTAAGASISAVLSRQYPFDPAPGALSEADNENALAQQRPPPA